MIDKQLAQKVLDEALMTGGDFSELFMEDTEGNSISMTDGNVENANYTRKHGAGVRVLKGNKCAYAYTADTSEDGLMFAAKAASAVITGLKECESKSIAIKDYSIPLSKPFSSIDNASRIALMKNGSAVAKNYSPEISQVQTSYLDIDRRIFVFNSDGLAVSDRQPRTRIFLEAVAMNGNEAQLGYSGPGLGTDFSAYDLIDIEATGRQVAKTAVTMLHAKQCPSGRFPVVIDGGFGGVILHEACVHSLEATSVAKGNSEFCGKLGQKIASDIVTAVDDGTLPGEWGTVRVDDEGTKTQRNILIENGILKTYLVDMLGARIMNHPLTGSSRRQDYTFAPTSRMTNTFFAPGKDDENEMIKSMGTGLYAAYMGGGSVNPLTGEFNFSVLEGYWVKNGEIVCPVRGATLIGKGAVVLNKIDRIGKSMWMGQGMCGSQSGSIPTNVGQPRIRVSEMTVGGKGEII
ncbi:MAG: TldD/PmbA family protein [Clostridia bacterium]